MENLNKSSKCKRCHENTVEPYELRKVGDVRVDEVPTNTYGRTVVQEGNNGLCYIINTLLVDIKVEKCTFCGEVEYIPLRKLSEQEKMSLEFAEKVKWDKTPKELRFSAWMGKRFYD